MKVVESEGERSSKMPICISFPLSGTTQDHVHVEHSHDRLSILINLNSDVDSALPHSVAASPAPAIAIVGTCPYTAKQTISQLEPPSLISILPSEIEKAFRDTANSHYEVVTGLFRFILTLAPELGAMIAQEILSSRVAPPDSECIDYLLQGVEYIIETYPELRTQLFGAVMSEDPDPNDGGTNFAKLCLEPGWEWLA